MKPTASTTILIALALGLGLTAHSSRLEARILNVPDDFETIQAGIAASRDGDTVLVSPGAYRETVNFGGKAIVVGSRILTTGDPIFIEETIIDGGDIRPCVVFDHGEGRESVLRGFTITRGFDNFYGGGIQCDQNSSPILQDLRIIHNKGNVRAGGIYCRYSSPLIKNCQIIENRIESSYGSALYITSSHLIMENCIVRGNFSEMDDEDSRINKAIYVSRSSLEMYDVEVSGHLGNEGSAICASLCEEIIIQDCRFTDNTGCVISIQNNGEFEGEIMVEFNRVLITSDARNTFFKMRKCVGTLDNLTIIPIRVNYNRPEFRDSELMIRNSIIATNGLYINSQERQVTLQYCDLVQGRDIIGLNGDNPLVWGEGNIAEDPLFIDPGTGDYGLRWGSPCIDAGDPESARDADSTRADMGAFPHLQHSTVEGWVSDSLNDTPISGAIITLSEVHSTHTDGEGFFRLSQTPANFHLNVQALGYRPYMSEDFHSEEDETLRVEIHLQPLQAILDPSEIVLTLPPDSLTQIDVTLTNQEDDILEWRAWVQSIDAEQNWTVLQSFDMTEMTGGDYRVEGVVFADDHFYIASGGSDPKMMYVFDRQGTLQRSFPQVGEGRWGMYDLTWDGELIWGSGERNVYGFTTEGQLETAFEGPVNVVQALAYDPERELLWLSGITSQFIYAYDRQGNEVEQLGRHGLYVYGLAYYPQDPDGYPLYIHTSRTGSDSTLIYKMNPDTGDTMLVADLTGLVEGNPRGAFIAQDWLDLYPVFMGVFSHVAGDRLNIFAMQGETTWLGLDEPWRGNLDPDASVEIPILISSRDLVPEVYRAGVWFEFPNLQGRLHLPVELRVEPLAAPDDDGQDALPTRFEITGAHPNPFNAQLTLTYTLPQAGEVKVGVYDVAGRLVAPPLNPPRKRGGMHTLTLDASSWPAGVYIVRMEAGDARAVRKVALVK